MSLSLNSTTTIKTSRFNLIKKEVALKGSLRREFRWYSLLNMLFIIALISLGSASYFLGVFLDQELILKKQEIVEYANNNVNIEDKPLVKSKINTLNDRYSLYEDMRSQNFDFVSFHDSFKRLYPSVQIVKFSYNQGSDVADIEILIPSSGYTELPKFLDAINKSDSFNQSKMESISFLVPDGSNSQDTDAALRMKLQVPIPNKLKNIENGY